MWRHEDKMSWVTSSQGSGGWQPVDAFAMGLSADTWNCWLRITRECRDRFPRHRLQRKSLVSDPGLHDGMCVTHVLWCISGSLIRGGWENFPGIPDACPTRNFRYLARGPLTGHSFHIDKTFWHRPFRVLLCGGQINGTLIDPQQHCLHIYADPSFQLEPPVKGCWSGIHLMWSFS